jgi:hypothetical protein
MLVVERLINTVYGQLQSNAEEFEDTVLSQVEVQDWRKI